MSQKDRQLISEVIRFPEDSVYAGFNVEWLNGSIDVTILALQGLNDFCLKLGYSNVSISSYSRWDDVVFEIVGTRPETDEEYKSRQAGIRAAQKAKRDAKKKLIEQESADYAEYLRLKELFES